MDHPAKSSKETLEWLLEESNPPVRCYTLTELLGMPQDAPEVVQARRGAIEAGPIPEILAEQ